MRRRSRFRRRSARRSWSRPAPAARPLQTGSARRLFFLASRDSEWILANPEVNPLGQKVGISSIGLIGIGGHPPTPVTLPCVQVRTRRFETVTPCSRQYLGSITKEIKIFADRNTPQ